MSYNFFNYVLWYGTQLLGEHINLNPETGSEAGSEKYQLLLQNMNRPEPFLEQEHILTRPAIIMYFQLSFFFYNHVLFIVFS